MKIKRIFAFIISLVTAVAVFAVPVCAENSAKANVFVSQSMIFDDNGLYYTTAPLIGENWVLGVSFKGAETLSYCDLTVTFNDSALEFTSASINYIDDNISYMPVFEYSADGNAVRAVISEKRGMAKTSLFSIFISFKVIGKGPLDIEVAIDNYKDGDGNSIDMAAEYSLPSSSYAKEEIPKVHPDFENTISYGRTRHFTTALGKPMTAGEFAASMVNTENCEVIVKNKNGDVLKSDDYISTESTLTVIFDTATVFESVFILLGDVNCDAQINAADARLSLRYSAGLCKGEERPGTHAVRAANVASDTDKITAADARKLLRYSAGLDETYSDWYDYHCLLNRTNRYVLNDNIK